MLEIIVAATVRPDHIPATVWWVVLAWLAALGASIGSFMNVVVYRMPLGLSIVHPGSRCPRCEHPIRGRDNIPLLSWILLRGGCRDCGCPISIRYPLVEATVAAMFVVVGMAVVLSAKPTGPAGGGLASVISINRWGIYAYYLLLMCTLICVSLIEFDAQPVPFRLLLPALLVGLIGPMVWDNLPPERWTAGAAMTGRWRGFAGFMVGGIGGSMIWVFSRTKGPLRPPYVTSVAAAGLLGAYTDWRAAALILSLTSVVGLAATVISGAVVRRSRVPWSMWLTIITLVYILSGERLVDRFGIFWPGSPWPAMGLAMGVILVASWLTQWVKQRQSGPGSTYTTG